VCFYVTLALSFCECDFARERGVNLLIDFELISVAFISDIRVL
jgi:hypothetical protein